MQHYLNICCLTSLILWPQGTPLSQLDSHELPETHVRFDSSEGQNRLRACRGGSEPFWRLVQFYRIQSDLGSCGVATAVCVLNSLNIPRPVSDTHGRHQLFTRKNIFEHEAPGLVTQSKVSRSGMTLSQLANLLRANGALVSIVHSSTSNCETFRKDISKSMKEKDTFVILNYSRKYLGQVGGGHFSPLAAFESKNDSVLVLDTATYKYPWCWVPLEDLWDAASTGRDSESLKSRGYLVVTGLR